MRAQAIADGRERTFAVVLETGEPVMENLREFARDQQFSAAAFTAIGAFSDAVLAWFDYEQREYREFAVDEQIEVLTLVGDIALGPDGTPQVHAHVVCGRRGGLTLGGHLMEAHVRPTLEIVLREAPAHLRKRVDPDSGLPLILPAE